MPKKGTAAAAVGVPSAIQLDAGSTTCTALPAVSNAPGGELWITVATERMGLPAAAMPPVGLTRDVGDDARRGDSGGDDKGTTARCGDRGAGAVLDVDVVDGLVPAGDGLFVGECLTVGTGAALGDTGASR